MGAGAVKEFGEKGKGKERMGKEEEDNDKWENYENEREECEERDERKEGRGERGGSGGMSSSNRAIKMLAEALSRDRNRAPAIQYPAPTHVKIFDPAAGMEIRPWLASLESHYKVYELDQTK